MENKLEDIHNKIYKPVVVSLPKSPKVLGKKKFVVRNASKIRVSRTKSSSKRHKKKETELKEAVMGSKYRDF